MLGSDHSLVVLSAENFVDFGRELKIKRADALNAVSVQVKLDLVPDVEPFGVMIHGFGRESDLGHFAKSSDEILALEIFVKLAVGQSPAGDGWELLMNFRFGEFLGRHRSLQSGGVTGLLCVGLREAARMRMRIARAIKGVIDWGCK